MTTQPISEPTSTTIAVERVDLLSMMQSDIHDLANIATRIQSRYAGASLNVASNLNYLNSEFIQAGDNLGSTLDHLLALSDLLEAQQRLERAKVKRLPSYSSAPSTWMNDHTDESYHTAPVAVVAIQEGGKV